MTLNPYEVFVTPSALDNWRALADDYAFIRAPEHYSAIKRTLRQAVEMSQAQAIDLGEDYDPKRLYYVADSPTRGRLVFVLRPNNPGETGHTLTRVLKKQR